MNADIKDYKELYLKTAREHLHIITKALTKLQHNHHDPVTIGDLILHFHSLKSASLVIGYNEIGEISKVIETFFHDIQNGTKQLSSSVVNHVVSATDVIKESVAAIRDGKPLPDLSKELKKIQTSL